jgi:hypothetical protein
VTERIGTARAASVSVLAGVAFILAALPSAGAEESRSGPVAVIAEEFEYLLHDPLSGSLLVGIFADSAEAKGGEAELTRVLVLRYREGSVAMRVTADEGSLARDGDTDLRGNVTIRWLGEAASARFQCSVLRLHRDTNEMACEDQVWGILRGPARDDVEEDGLTMRVIGWGLRVSPEGDRGEVIRGAVINVSGAAYGPWVVSADAGFSFHENAGGVTLRLRGPVEARGTDVTWSADAAEFILVSSEDGELRLGRAFATGSVHAEGSVDGLQLGDQGRRGRFKAWAAAADIAAAGPAVLMGTPEDPARVEFDRGELRGTRVELGPGIARSEGGATSVFEWKGQR